MAYEASVFKIPGLEANGDISTKQFYAVKMTTTDRRVVVCTVDGEVVTGVLQNKPSAAGDAAEVMGLGVTKVIAAETLTAGDFWGTDSSGKAKLIEGTVTGADVGDYAAGQVIEGCAANEYATVTIGFPTFKVEAQ